MNTLFIVPLSVGQSDAVLPVLFVILKGTRGVKGPYVTAHPGNYGYVCLSAVHSLVIA